MRRIGVFSPVLFTILLAVLSAGAFAYEANKVDGTDVEIQWSTSSVTYYLNASGGPSGALDAFKAALQTWTDVAASSFTFVYGGTTDSTACGVQDGTNRICFGAISSAGVLARNLFWYSASTGRIIDSDITFNTNYTWKTDGSSGSYDVQNVATHELGHSLSLADLYSASDSEKTMYGYSGAGETKKRTLDQDDIDGISHLYPASGAAYTLSGKVTSGSSGLPGVTVILSGAKSATALTDSSGNYAFTGLSDGNYTVTPNKSGYAFSPSSRSATVSGANVTGQDFSASAVYALTGRITIGGAGLSGVTVALSGTASSAATTNSQGYYVFPALGNGSYTVTPGKSGYAFTPSSLSVTVSGARVTGKSFTAKPSTPAGLSASDGTYTDKVTLSWSSVSSAASYAVYRSETAEGKKRKVGTSRSTSFNDTSGASGKSYSYFVTAVAGNGVESDYSSLDTGYRRTQ